MAKKTISGYALIEVIGRGGMGTIWRGTQIATGRTVAVKMLHPKFVQNETFRKRFLVEARAQARLSHPHIADLIALVEERGKYAIVMEFLEGQTLAERIKARGPIPVEEGLAIFRQVLDAVAHAHSLGVLHRDLKPANVIVLPDDMAKVTDFGTAKIIGGETLTLEGTTIGSPLYMSPEQITGEPPSPQADVYSLGVTLFQMCTGRPPFEGSNIADLVRRLKTDPPPHPSMVNPRLPNALGDIILKAMAKTKEERYESVEAFRSALDGYRSKRLPVVREELAPRPDEGSPVWLLFVFLPIIAVLVVVLPRYFSMNYIVGIVALLALGILWRGRSPKPTRCTRCGREMEKDWETCLFCEKGLPPPRIEAVLKKNGERWPLPPGTTMVGRQPPCPICIDDERVSSQHAEIRHRDGLLTIVDLGSTNGTRLNGHALKPGLATPIYSGDKLRFGRTTLLVEAAPLSADPPSSGTRP